MSVLSAPKVLCLSRMLDPVVSSFSVFFQVNSLCSYRFPWAPVCSPGQVPVGSKPILRFIVTTMNPDHCRAQRIFGFFGGARPPAHHTGGWKKYTTHGPHLRTEGVF